MKRMIFKAEIDVDLYVTEEQAELMLLAFNDGTDDMIETLQEWAVEQLVYGVDSVNYIDITELRAV